MATKRYDKPISDAEIKEKMLKHSNTAGSVDRDLIRVKVPNGQGDMGANHEIFALHGSPIKGFAVRKRNELYMYESDGTRWATYILDSRKDPVEYEVSKTKEDLTEMWAESRNNNDDIDIEERVQEELRSKTSLVDHPVEPQDIVDEVDTDLDAEEVQGQVPPGDAPTDIQAEINILNKISRLKDDGYKPFKVLRPYHAESDEIKELTRICDKYGCEFWILGATNYLKDREEYREMTFSIILARKE
jgi:hypothetical protein